MRCLPINNRMDYSTHVHKTKNTSLKYHHYAHPHTLHNLSMTVLRLLKDKFHHCLNMCKSLEYQTTLSSTIGRAVLELIAPDKLIYDYAIEMCQTAALEEMFGQPEECFKRYQTAQILLHGLLHQVSQEDRPVLAKYKVAVEKRLLMIQHQFQQQIQHPQQFGNPCSPFGPKGSSRCSY